MEKQVTILFAGTRGFLDDYPVEVVAKYEAGLFKFVDERYPQLFEGLQKEQAFTEELEKLAEEALKAYDEEFKDTIQ